RPVDHPRPGRRRARRPDRARPVSGPPSGGSELADAWTARFGDEASTEETHGGLAVGVPPERWVEALTFARDDLSCGFFDWLTGVDELDEGFAVVAHVYSLERRHHLLVRTRVPRRAPVLATATAPRGTHGGPRLCSAAASRATRTWCRCCSPRGSRGIRSARTSSSPRASRNRGRAPRIRASRGTARRAAAASARRGCRTTG